MPTKVNPQSGSYTGVDILLSGTRKEIPPPCSTVKETKWTRYKWSLSKRPSPRLASKGRRPRPDASAYQREGDESCHNPVDQMEDEAASIEHQVRQVGGSEKIRNR